MTNGLPSPRPFSDGPSLGWGVIGPGWIAARFVTALLECTRQRLVAVASRSEARAKSFADKFEARSSYGSYDHLLMDPEVDAVYVATPHNEHARLALMAVAAGKHVLVEKPFATSAEEARDVVESARGAGVLAMEAMWTRYLPGFDVLRQVLESGEVGEVAEVSADFGFMLPLTDRAGFTTLRWGVGLCLTPGSIRSRWSRLSSEPLRLFFARVRWPRAGSRTSAVVVTRHGSATGIASTSHTRCDACPRHDLRTGRLCRIGTAVHRGAQGCP